MIVPLRLRRIRQLQTIVTTEAGQRAIIGEGNLARHYAGLRNRRLQMLFQLILEIADSVHRETGMLGNWTSYDFRKAYRFGLTINREGLIGLSTGKEGYLIELLESSLRPAFAEGFLNYLRLRSIQGILRGEVFELDHGIWKLLNLLLRYPKLGSATADFDQHEKADLSSIWFSTAAETRMELFRALLKRRQDTGNRAHSGRSVPYVELLGQLFGLIYSWQAPSPRLLLIVALSSSCLVTGLLVSQVGSFVFGALAMLASFPAAFVAFQSIAFGSLFRSIQPRHPVMLEFSIAAHQSDDTAVVIPLLIHSIEQAEAVAVSGCRALVDSGLKSATLVFLTDFPDSRETSADSPHELGLLSTLVESIRRESRRGMRWCVLHRDREFVPSQVVYMGKERKRGKIDLFNSFIATGYNGFSVSFGAVENLSELKYAIVLDEDSVLVEFSGVALRAVMAHPVNRPIIIEGRLTSGFTIVTGHVCPRPTALRRRWYDGVAEVHPWDPIFNRYADRYFSGKGIYDIRSFYALTRGAIPNGVVLSHDAIEGLLGRVAHCAVAKIEEDVPLEFSQLCERSHRWCRGDVQNIFSFCAGKFNFDRSPSRSEIQDLYFIRIGSEISHRILHPLLTASLALAVDVNASWTALMILLALVLARTTVAVMHVLSELSLLRVDRLSGLKNALSGIFTQDIWDMVVSPIRASLYLDATTRGISRSLSQKRALEWSSASSIAENRRTPAFRRAAGLASTVSALALVASQAIGIAGSSLVAVLSFWTITSAVMWKRVR